MPDQATCASEPVEALSRLLDRTFREAPRPFPLAFDASATAAEPRHFALALAAAMAGSGVFFESHLAEWARGERSLEEVRAEATSRAAGEAALQQQISLLVTDEMAFQFATLPGHSASLTVGLDPEDTGGDDAVERDFIARLESGFDALGRVRAILSVTTHGIDVALRADSQQTAATMRNGLASLVSSFFAAGLRPGRIGVENA